MENEVQLKKKAINIWLDINSFVDDICDCVAALQAIQNYKQKEENAILNNEFLEISEESIWRHLSLEIVKLFDHAKSGKHENCSFAMLKKVLLESNLQSREGLAEMIERLYIKEKKVLPREIRDKKIAHHDLYELEKGECYTAKFADVCKLINEMEFALSVIGNEITFIEYPKTVMKERIRKYEEAITMLGK